jgi:hypothetical protein
VLIAVKGPYGQAQVKGLYQKILQRNPTDLEILDALKFLTRADGVNQNNAFNQLAQVLFLSNEFGFVD